MADPLHRNVVCCLAFCVLLAAPRALRLVSFGELWGNGVWGVMVRGVYAALDGDAHEGEGGKEGKIPERDAGTREQPCLR